MAHLSSQSKFKITRRGRKLQLSDDQRTLMALPKEVPERTWAEILQKEDNELLLFDIREEIVETVLQIGYKQYMERQTAVFSVYCATEAWLKLMNWAEILQKEDNELLLFDIREEIVETVLQIGYKQYMERQTAVFSVYCAIEAWLKLMNK